MNMAIVELADARAADLAREYELTVTTKGMLWHMLEDARIVLWEALVRRAQRGEIVVRGVLDPLVGAVTISPDALRGSKPDFLEDTLAVAGLTFYSVDVARILQQTPPPSPQVDVASAVYSQDALAAWFRLREGTWPSEAPFPTEQADRIAAESYFKVVPARDEFRRIRGEKTSSEWRKRGPRASR